MIHSCHRSNLGLINPLHHVDHSLRNILSSETYLYVKQDEYEIIRKSKKALACVWGTDRKYLQK